MKASSRKGHDLSSRNKDEGAAVPLDVQVRAGLRKKLELIGRREDRSLDYVVDEILRWAVEEYRSSRDLRGLLRSVTDFAAQPNDDLDDAA